MKHSIIKGFVLAVAVALILTGCNLIEIDEVMQANSDIAKLNTKYAVPVATYDGGEVTVAEAVYEFNSEYTNMAMMYYYYLGMSLTSDDVALIAQQSLEVKVEEEIVAAHFDADGYTLTEEQVQEAETAADEEYAEAHDQVFASATGKNDEAKEANTQLALAQVGQTREQIGAAKLQAQKANQMKQKLRDQVTEVTDDELQTAYDSMLAENKETYDADPASYGTDMMSDPDKLVAYVPAGYRTVRHILVIPEDSVKTAYSDAVSALKSANTELTTLQNEKAALESAEDTTGMRSAEDIQADIDAATAKVEECTANVETARQACLDNVSEKTTAIYAELEAGTPFEEVMAKYGEDPGMQDEKTAATGYYVCAGSTNWVQAFTDGAMALENVGDYSAEPVVSTSGVHIIEYYKDIPAGEIALETIHDALYEETLEQKKDTYATETVAGWISDANPTYDATTLMNTVMQG